MWETSAKRILFVPKRDRRATLFMLEEYVSFATNRGVSYKTATRHLNMKGRSVLLGDSVKGQECR